MVADESLTESRTAIRRLVSGWAGTPAFLCDRHFTVIVANDLAHALSPAFREGMNLARFTFMEPNVDRRDPAYDRVSQQVVALLRESLDEHRGDDVFRSIVGDLSVDSAEFATAWADDTLKATSRGVAEFVDTRAGSLRLQYELLRMPGNGEDTLFVWGPADVESTRSVRNLVDSATRGHVFSS
ncbi:hypothetical protein [Microbacterium sp. P04]|uniref:MmyB family transcriptional regulator n=1 Tax=Microbacterium sp. P04 TaxID=3366947 RepID=UPI003745C826